MGVAAVVASGTPRAAARLVEQRDPIHERLLAVGDLSRQVDARGRDAGAQQRGLQRAREDHRAAAGAHQAGGLRVREHHDGAARRKRLGQRGDHHGALRRRTVAEHGAAPVGPRPAHAVCVVDVQRQAFVARQQLLQLGERRQVAVHAVDAVGEIPDPPMPLGQRAHQLVQAIDAAVADEAAGRPRRLERRQHSLHAVVHQLVAHHRVFAADQDGERGEVRQRGRLRDDHRRAEHRVQQALELGVRRARDIGARRRELHAVARDRVARPVFEARVGLQSQVRTRPEVHVRAPVQRHQAAAELRVLGDEVADAARDRVAHRIVDEPQPRADRVRRADVRVILTDRRPA